MKDWIKQLCPEIAGWQVDLIVEQVDLAVAAEREACAKLCEEMARRHDDIRRAALEVAAEWIRARGNE